MTQDPAWIAFLAASGVGMVSAGAWFWRLEKPGLEPDKGPLTLSWTTRRWLGVRPKAARRFVLVPIFVLLCGAVVGGAVWFPWHILAQ